MFRKTIVSTLALSLFAVPAVMAQETEEGEGRAVLERPERAERGTVRIFNSLDEDGDGAIAEEEFGGKRLEMLQAADSDGNGTLTQEEIATYLMNREFQRRAERAAEWLDVDGNGTVTLAEIEDHQGKRFALFDRDNDGQISQDEMRRATFGLHTMHMRGMGDDDGRRFKMHRGGHGPRHRSIHRMEPSTPGTPAEQAPSEE